MKKALLVSLFSMTFASPVVCGEKFDRVIGVFDSAVALTPVSFSGEHAYAGYCVHVDDQIDDALFAYRQGSDPIMGQTVKSLELQHEGSSNEYVRMDVEAVKKEIDETDPSAWNDGSWDGDELFSRVHWRFQTIIRLAYNADRTESFYVAKRQCRSIDGRECNGSGSTPFRTYEACYYFSKKF